MGVYLGARRRTSRLTAAVLAFLLVFSASFALGQGIVTGSISGTVVDPQKAVVTGASITVTSVGTNATFTGTSNAEGIFSLRSLPVGSYRLSIEAQGFAKLQVGAVVVNAGKDTALGEEELKIGASEVVNVEGTAPLIETNTSAVSTSFDARRATDLPIGTGFDALTTYVPGVVNAGNIGFGNNNGAQASFNGQRNRSDNFQIDGQANNDNSVTGPALGVMNPDLVAEFQVVTNFSAEYGRNTGGVINVITKGGTNNYHGTVFDYHRNSVFDSLTHDEKSPAPFGAGLTKPGKYIENRYGFTVGGPVKKDKMWFFGSGIWDPIRQAGFVSSSGSSIIPTPAGLATLKAAFPNSVGVALLDKIGPTSKTFGNPVYTPLAAPIRITDGTTNALVQFGTVQRFVALPSNEKQFSARYDYQISSKDRFSARYIIDNQDNPLGANANSVQGFRVDVPSRAQNVSLDYTRNITNNVVNQARLSYGRTRVAFEAGTTGCTNATITTCATAVTLTSTSSVFPNPLLSFGLNTGFPQDRLVNNTQYQDNASWLRGKHLIKFGGEYDQQRSPSTFLPNINGLFTFRDTTLNGVAFTAFDNLVRNTPSVFNLTDGPSTFNFKEKDASWYLQDDWRIRENLTLNLGVRWEWSQQAFNLLHDLTVARQQSPAPFWDPNLPLSVTTSPKIPEDLNNFAPKVGFAYTPRILSGLFGNGKTVFRGGFGISYDIPYYNIFLNTAGSAPVVNAGQLSSAAGDTVPAIPSGASTGDAVRNALLGSIPRLKNPGQRNYTTVNPNFHNPYVEQWTFGMQREINSRIAAEVRYLGNHGVGLFRSVDANPSLSFLSANFPNLIPAGVAPCSDKNAPGFTGKYVNCANTNVFERNNGASSNYHSLQSRLDLRSWHNITSSVAYTWSHTIDTTSEVFTDTTVGQVPVAQNPFNVSAGERGRSGIDFPNNLAVQLIYDLPFHQSQQGWLGHALGGWSTNWTYRYNSGAPWTPIQRVPSAALNGSMCDPQGNFSFTTDTCRPILANKDAPLNSVGRLSAPAAGAVTLTNVATGAAIATLGTTGSVQNLSQVHWLVNDVNSAKFLGSPFLGVGRMTERGDYVNNANLSIFKTTKVSEQIKLQFQATAFNVLNREFLGQPGININNASTSFANWKFNADGDASSNAVQSGIGRRRMEFALKVIF